MTAQIALLLTLVLSGPLYAKDLAVVDGQTLTEAELKNSAEGLGPRAQMMLGNPTARRQFLDHLIDTRLLAKAATAAGTDKSAEFESLLAAARAQILATLYMKNYLDSHLTDEAITAFFNKNPQRFSKKEIRASHIILQDEAEALKVLAEAQKPGIDFEVLAKQRSTGTSAPRGGDLGFFSRGRMVAAFEDAAFATPKGQIHPKPVKTQFGWHVIKVVDVRGSDDVKLADVKGRVKEQLEQELKAELTKELRDKAKVAVDENAVKDANF